MAGKRKLEMEAVKKNYAGRDGHGWDHVVRVHRMSMWIASQLGADEEVIWAAALRHDMARAMEKKMNVAAMPNKVRGWPNRSLLRRVFHLKRWNRLPTA